MAKSIDIDELKQRTIEFGQTWQKKFNHLSDSISRSGIEGISHWMKSHQQMDEFTAALGDLVKASEQDNFTLLQVDTTFSSFTLPDEDLGQAEWYKTAHNYLQGFEQALINDNRFDSKQLKSALNELKFICQADEFHQRYAIENIQQKVAKVYQVLQQALSDYKTIEKEKLSHKKSDDEIKKAQIETEKAQAETKTAMIENIKTKEKRIAIMEEKKRLIAEKELVEAQEKQLNEETEIKARQAELERQAKLQDSYIELQVEEKISHLGINELTKKITEKLDQTDLSEDDQQALIVLSDSIKKIS